MIGYMLDISETLIPIDHPVGEHVARAMSITICLKLNETCIGIPAFCPYFRESWTYIDWFWS